MKLTNGEISIARNPIQALLKTKLPVKTSWALARLAVKLNDPLDALDKVRKGLFDTYGMPNPQSPTQLFCPPVIEKKDENGKLAKDEAGNPVMIPNPKFSKFNAEMNDLMAQEMELVFDVIELPEKVAATCDKCGHNMDRALEIEPEHLMALRKFVKIK